jgi:cysteinyl-tRNA synthetase
MLKIYNSLTRKIEPFKATIDKQVKMYTCGPSTYQQAHIGNYRTFLFEDLLQRFLEFLNYRVKRLMTLTDVEDKAILQAEKERITVEELTAKNEAIFFQDFELLRIKKPDLAVRASTAVNQSVRLIVSLVEKGVAYWHMYAGEKNVYFDPLKFEGFGKLAHLDMTKWPNKKRRFHKDTYPGTPWNRGDFVLWHSCKQEDVCFETEIGRGRPAWNIQDAAVVTKHLGFSIDVACGGIDNLVRHHDYTLAIVESISNKQFSRYWLHGGHLYVDGKKMSKSKGNVYYPSDVVSKGFSGDQLRFFLIYGPYRRKMNFTWKRMAETSKRLDSFKAMVRTLLMTESHMHSSIEDSLCNRLDKDFEAFMNSDLNFKGAFDHLYENVEKLYLTRKTLSCENIKKIEEKLSKIDNVLQCIF